MYVNSVVLGNIFAGLGGAIIVMAYFLLKPNQPTRPILIPDEIAQMAADRAVEKLHEAIEKELAKHQTSPSACTRGTGRSVATADPKFRPNRWNPDLGVFEMIESGILFHCRLPEGPGREEIIG